MGRLEGILGGLGAIVGVLEQSFGERGSSWKVLGVSWEASGVLMEVWSEPREGQTLWVNVAWDGGVELSVCGGHGGDCRGEGSRTPRDPKGSEDLFDARVPELSTLGGRGARQVLPHAVSCRIRPC